MFTMTFSSLVRRAVKRRRATPPSGVSSRPVAPARGSAGGRGAVVDSQPERHPAMARIDVSPVHGRHCDCDRCRREQHAGDAGRRPAA
jgi:hypothetical protein